MPALTLADLRSIAFKWTNGRRRSHCCIRSTSRASASRACFIRYVRRESRMTYVENRISFLSTVGHLLSIPTSGASGNFETRPTPTTRLSNPPCALLLYSNSVCLLLPFSVCELCVSLSVCLYVYMSVCLPVCESGSLRLHEPFDVAQRMTLSLSRR